jgi:hypothetical protein
MAKNFSDVINKIMPLVKDGDTATPFIIFRKTDDTNAPWFVSFPYPAENARNALETLRKGDPCAAMFTGRSFDDGSFSFVHDKVVCTRLYLEYLAAPFDTVHNGELRALLGAVEDNIGQFSQKTIDYLLQFDKPLQRLYELNPVQLRNGDNPRDEPYDADKIDEFIGAVERKTAELADSPQDGQKRVIDGYTEKYSAKLAGHLVILAENQAADEPYMVCYRKLDTGVYYNVCTTAEFIDAFSLYLAGIQSFTQILENERAQKNIPEHVITSERCLPDSKNADFTGKIVVVDAKSLQPDSRNIFSQLVICTRDGKKVFGTELFTGQSVIYGRHKIIGVADESLMPRWVTAKIEQRRDPSIFEHGGYHFKPYRNYKYGEIDKHLEGDSRLWKTDASYAFRNMSSDPAMKPLVSPNLNAEFYASANGGATDIFVCVENGKLYVPGNSELFLYSEPTEKELRVAENRALKEYGSVIDTAISEGVERKSVPHTLEVLDARFGREKTDELLATVALTSLEKDGRISGIRRKWAKSVIGDIHGLKPIRVKSHPAHFDNLIMYAMQRGAPQQYNPAPEAEKPDLLAKINGNKQ